MGPGTAPALFGPTFRPPDGSSQAIEPPPVPTVTMSIMGSLTGKRPIEPLVVTARRTAMYMAGFEDRRRMGFGRFMTREDFDVHASTRVTDLLRNLPAFPLPDVPLPGEPVPEVPLETPDRGEPRHLAGWPVAPDGAVVRIVLSDGAAQTMVSFTADGRVVCAQDTSARSRMLSSNPMRTAWVSVRRHPK